MSSSHITVDEHHFCHAARDGDVDVVRAELSRGVPPDTRYRGQTALMYAAEADRADVCAVLLENGARPDAIDTYGRTPLHLCSRTTALSACRVLLEYGAAATSDVPSRMGLGETAVDVAKHRGVIELVRLVVFKKGVDLDSKRSNIFVKPPNESTPTLEMIKRMMKAEEGDKASKQVDEVSPTEEVVPAEAGAGVAQGVTSTPEKPQQEAASENGAITPPNRAIPLIAEAVATEQLPDSNNNTSGEFQPGNGADGRGLCMSPTNPLNASWSYSMCINNSTSTEGASPMVPTKMKLPVAVQVLELIKGGAAAEASYQLSGEVQVRSKTRFLSQPVNGVTETLEFQLRLAFPVAAEAAVVNVNPHCGQLLDDSKTTMVLRMHSLISADSPGGSAAVTVAKYSCAAVRGVLAPSNILRCQWTPVPTEGPGCHQLMWAVHRELQATGLRLHVEPASNTTGPYKVVTAEPALTNGNRTWVLSPTQPSSSSKLVIARPAAKVAKPLPRVMFDLEASCKSAVSRSGLVCDVPPGTGYTIAGGVRFRCTCVGVPYVPPPASGAPSRPGTTGPTSPTQPPLATKPPSMQKLMQLPPMPPVAPVPQVPRAAPTPERDTTTLDPSPRVVL
eukprot:PhM_4_TR4912/c0_g1_i2/m.57070